MESGFGVSVSMSSNEIGLSWECPIGGFSAFVSGIDTVIGVSTCGNFDVVAAGGRIPARSPDSNWRGRMPSGTS